MIERSRAADLIPEVLPQPTPLDKRYGRTTLARVGRGG
jgi:hypothetical protein